MRLAKDIARLDGHHGSCSGMAGDGSNPPATQWYCARCVDDRTGLPYLNFARRASCRECGKPKAVCGRAGKAGGKGGGGGGKGGGGKGGGGGGSGGKGGGGGPAAAAKLYADHRAKDKQLEALQAKVAKLEAAAKAKESPGTDPADATGTSPEVGGAEGGEEPAGELKQKIDQLEAHVYKLESILADGSDETMQAALDAKQAELQRLRAKRRAGKPITTQKWELEGKIKKKEDQLQRKDKAMEGLRLERDEIELKRAALDRREAAMAQETAQLQVALDGFLEEKAQLEAQVVPEVRNQGALLQQVMGYFTAAVDGKPGADPATALRNVQQLLALNGQACQEPPAATCMETDGEGAGAGSNGGEDLDSINLDEDYDSEEREDPAVGLGMEVPTSAARASGARRGRSTGNDSPGRSRSASLRRRREERGKAGGGAGRPEGGGISA